MVKNDLDLQPMIKLIKSTFHNEKLTKKTLADFIKKSDQLSIGKMCSQFESDFSKWQKRKYSVMFNSGSSANLALIQALINLGKIKEADTVGFSGITWATNVMPLMTLNLKVLPIDIDIETLNISSKNVEQAYGKKKFKCLFVTNVLGWSGDLDKITSFCKKNNILLIEDNCESLGSVYKNKKLGNFGIASTFSFYVGHHLSTIEGGMVCTDNKELDTMLRIVRSHGMDRHLDKKEQKITRNSHKVDDFYGKYTFYHTGYNLRPTEINGFIGVNQLKYLDKMVGQRQKNYRKLEKIYSNQDFIKMKTENMTIFSNFAFPIICKNKDLKEKYVKLAEKYNIEVRPIVGGDMTKQPFFSKKIKEKFHLPNTEKIHDNGFYFGNNPEMTSREIAILIKTFA